MDAHSTFFWHPKAGSSAHEWEDGAGAGAGRFVVVDGATEAYDSLRWVAQLVTSFVHTGPAVTPEALGDWFTAMQKQWVADAPTVFANVIEEYKFRTDGSFATFLGGELLDLDGPRPRWAAAALGDTVLFHVRDGDLVAHFPNMSADDFGLSPEGLDTRPAALPQMLRGLTFARGDLRPGDTLYVATDALAHWMLKANHPLWTVLSTLDHPDTFRELVADQRRAGRMRNDDVTLLRIRFTERPPSRLVVCL